MESLTLWGFYEIFFFLKIKLNKPVTLGNNNDVFENFNKFNIIINKV